MRKLIFEGETFKAIRGPIVYSFWKDGEALYIGSSKNGLARPFDRQHRYARRSLGFADRMEIIPCDTRFDALSLEEALIQEHVPRYNSIRESADTNRQQAVQFFRGVATFEPELLPMPYVPAPSLKESKLKDFIEQCCEPGESYRSKSTDLYRKFIQWSGWNSFSHTRFGEAMQTKYTRRMINGRVFYDGIRLKGISPFVG